MRGNVGLVGYLQRIGLRFRARRMRRMVELLRLPAGARVVDLGGTEDVWRLIDHDFRVTIVNLPGTNPAVSDPGRFARVEADCCDLASHFPDGRFDLAFSNATIEHVGDEARQARFAAEVRRLSQAYWVETPSSRCPIECHTGIPFYWSLPRAWREAILDRWARRYPAWVDFLRATRVLSRGRMEALFPGSRVHVERGLGLEKSYSFYRGQREGSCDKAQQTLSGVCVTGSG